MSLFEEYAQTLEPLPQKIRDESDPNGQKSIYVENRGGIISLFLYLTVLHVQTLKNGYGTPGECQKEELYCH